MTLDEIIPYKPAIIKEITASGILLQKLFDMGFIEGTSIKLIRHSPLKDPIEVELLSYHITLRVNEAKAVKVSYE
ncbi:FeoA family protein [Arcobacter nitrofigilis DSM 7299]|uniref:FeoA family protein n=1 Tax=Arcobacter nitrofigilis (strain ATCC 33309 / DSM 7299 / CCUG 15893 / LMG 7604 / NCTC 12251 / CI) TaxID=572480 RepID=D5UZI9_ARCNC|nr:ferrous iron transport protein A [Arcobacter nitrofigilis]ADG92226.1 FeoA family protein [Arcobacter nitrofigilis DSM 7299]